MLFKIKSILIVSILCLGLIFSSPIGKSSNGFDNTTYLGYELLDNNSILHMWNTHDDYYFNVSNGIQFSNHYNDKWTQNVMMLGFFYGDK